MSIKKEGSFFKSIVVGSKRFIKSRQFVGFYTMIKSKGLVFMFSAYFVD